APPSRARGGPPASGPGAGAAGRARPRRREERPRLEVGFRRRVRAGAAMGLDSNTGLTKLSWILGPPGNAALPGRSRLQRGKVPAVDRVHLAGDPFGGVAAQEDGERGGSRDAAEAARGGPAGETLLEGGVPLARGGRPGVLHRPGPPAVP